MPFDEQLADRVREELGSMPGISERRMFGGLAFFVAGNMGVCVQRDELMIRIASEAKASVLAEPEVRISVMGGRQMSGWVVVSALGLADHASLSAWVQRGMAYAAALPPKPGA